MNLAMSRGQRGAGSIGCLLLLAILGFAGYAGYMLGIPKLRHSSFEDRVNESLYDLRQISEDEMRKEVLKIAGEFDIALKPEQVVVQKTPSRLNIHVTYDKPIDLKVWQTTLHFVLDRTAPL